MMKLRSSSLPRAALLLVVLVAVSTLGSTASASATSGWTAEYTRKGGHKVTLRYAKGRIRLDDSQRGTSVVWDVKKRTYTFWLVPGEMDLPPEMVNVIERGTFDALYAPIADEVARKQKNDAAVEASIREQGAKGSGAEALKQAQQALVAAREAERPSPDGRPKTINGYRCQPHAFTVRDRVAICLATSLKGVSLRPYMRDVDSLFSAARKAGAAESSLMRKFSAWITVGSWGVPVAFDEGRSLTELTRFEEATLDDGVFEAPAGLRPAPFPMMN